MLRADFSIQSSNTPDVDFLAKNVAGKIQFMERGMIFKVYYADDPANPTANASTPEVVYDVILVSGPMQGQVIPFCRTSSGLGGQYSYEETVYRKASKPFSGPGRVPFAQQDGDVVLLDFIDGNIGSGVIVGSMSHALDTGNTGATKADGPRWVKEFNGLHQTINKNGEMIITRKGGKYDATTDVFTPVATGNEAEIKLSKDALSLSATMGSVKVALDGKAKTITMMTPSGASVTVDGTANKVTVTAKDGSAQIIMDGASGTLTLVGDMINVGKMAQSLSLLGTEFSAWAASHTHMVPQAPAGQLPSQPPIAPPPSSTLSGTVKIQK